MKNLIKIFLFVLNVTWVGQAFCLQPKIDSIKCEVLLNQDIINDFKVNENFINDFQITSNRQILLSTASKFYLLGWGGIKPIGEKVVGPIRSFAFTTDGLLMVIHDNELCYFDSIGNQPKLFGLPDRNMGIATGENVMYIYGRDINAKKHSLYVVAKGGGYIELFRVPTSITSVIEFSDSILFATENKIFSFNPRTKKLKALVVLMKDEEILSLEVNDSKDIIYFSTENKLYAIKDSKVGSVTDELGGYLKYYYDGLLVFNPKKKFLIRIRGFEKLNPH